MNLAERHTHKAILGRTDWIEMGQEDIYLMLKELGGRATTSELRKMAVERFGPQSTNTQISHYLNRAMKWGIVDRDTDGTWFIKDGDENWDRKYDEHIQSGNLKGAL